MEIPYELFYLSTFFFAVMVVVSFFRAYREKEKLYYLGAVLCLLGLVWSILFVIEQVPLAGLVWVVAMMVSIVMLPKLTAFQDRQIREVDVESPLRVRDFFFNRYSGWLKLAYRHGLMVTAILYLMYSELIDGVMLLALDLFYDLPSGLITSTLTATTFSVVWFCRPIKKALTSIRVSS